MSDVTEYLHLFEYDETSPTFLRWKNKYRMGRAGKPVRRINNGSAGNINAGGGLSVTITKNKVVSIAKIVWELHHGPVPESKNILYIDGNIKNCNISNLELSKELEMSHKYDSYLGEYFYYDETSPSCLRWKKKYNICSTVNVGDVVGSLDNGYWKVHALGKSLKGHKIIWALHNAFENQDGLHIDHINRDPSDNRISNLRLVDRFVNARNKGLSKTNKTGTTGVSYQEFYNERNTLIMRYVAAVTEPITGVHLTKSFSAVKYGVDAAFDMACKWRQSKIEEFNISGAGYTEDHGK